MSVKFVLGVKILGFLVFFVRIRQKKIKPPIKTMDGLYMNTVLSDFL